MKIQRFVASDVRQTIRKVREALGPDAVILSNKRVDSGVEIVAAVDYDESLFGGTVANPYSESYESTQPEQENNAQGRIDEEYEKFRQQVWDDVKYSRNIPVSEKDKVISPTSQNSNTAEADVAIETISNVSAESFSHMENEIKSLRGILMQQLSGLAWERETQFHPFRARLIQRLISLGLSPRIAKSIAADLNQETDFETMWRQALGVLSHKIPVLGDDLLRTGGIVAIVGPTGVGKTTTIAKLASRYALKHGRESVGLISTDNHRVAAQEQLRGYARILGVPMRTVNDAVSLNEALQSLRNRKFILIDTAGISLHDAKLSEQLGFIRDGAKQIRMFLCMDANSQRSVLQQSVNAFNKVQLDGCILTKLDETTSLGGTFAVAIEHNLPVAYYCDGQQIPEDLHIARAHNLVSRAVSIMQRSVAIHDETAAQTVSGIVAHAYG